MGRSFHGLRGGMGVELYPLARHGDDDANAHRSNEIAMDVARIASTPSVRLTNLRSPSREKLRAMTSTVATGVSIISKNAKIDHGGWVSIRNCSRYVLERKDFGRERMPIDDGPDSPDEEHDRRKQETASKHLHCGLVDGIFAGNLVLGHQRMLGSSMFSASRMRRNPR